MLDLSILSFIGVCVQLATNLKVSDAIENQYSEDRCYEDGPLCWQCE